MTLDQLEVDVPAEVTAVESGDSVMLRLMEMGLVPGAPVSVEQRAPFGGPLQLRIRDYILSLRATEAARITVKTL